VYSLNDVTDWPTDDGGDDDHSVRKRKREPGEKTLFDTIQVCFAHTQCVIYTTLLPLARLRAHTLTIPFNLHDLNKVLTQSLRIVLGAEGSDATE
jgi:hypothetical protein